jgi:formylglycine-generating enzyme required for sulfatase activity
VALLACLLLGASSCDDDDDGANRAPEIQSVSASPTSVAAGGLTTLTCTATDADGDALEYSWSGAVGSFPVGAGQSSVQWQAPDINGTYTISVEVSDGQVVDTSSVAVHVSGTANTAPTASFTLTPSSGTTATTFQVDASGCTDAQTPTAQLEARWDWTNDGTYDTSWSTTKTASHQYSFIDNYTIKLQVRDPEGLTGETTHSVTVTGGGGGGVPEMVLIPAGQFMMGQAGVATPEHEVTLTNDFLLGRTEVTNQQYLEALQWAYDHPAQTGVSATASTVTAYGVELLDLDATNYCEIAFNTGTQQFYLVARTYNQGTWGPGFAYPGGSYDPGTHPVKEVSWYGAACYCDWRSQMENLPLYYEGQWNQIPSPRNPYAAEGYRLPTEAEWEFAAQYDDERSYPWGNATPTCTLANYRPSGLCVGWTSPVGAHLSGASALGLQDMAGNLWEWCNDWHTSHSSSPQNNPAGPNSGSIRVLRGGCWYTDASYLACAFRTGNPPSYTSYLSGGFRLCRTLP